MKRSDSYITRLAGDRKKIIFSDLLLELTFWNYKKLKYLDIENVEEKITY